MPNNNDQDHNNKLNFEGVSGCDSKTSRKYLGIDCSPLMSTKTKPKLLCECLESRFVSSLIYNRSKIEMNLEEANEMLTTARNV